MTETDFFTITSHCPYSLTVLTLPWVCKILLIRVDQNLHKPTNIKEWWIECLQKHLSKAEALTETDLLLRVHTISLC